MSEFKSQICHLDLAALSPSSGTPRVSYLTSPGFYVLPCPVGFMTEPASGLLEGLNDQSTENSFGTM